jgi:ribosome-associated toxin RatA of RatAB toxin-antitoxin module
MRCAPQLYHPQRARRSPAGGGISGGWPVFCVDGTWGFSPLTLPGGDEGSACKIEFNLRYAFSSRALELVVSPVFDRIANTFVDSFVARAEQVYGPR